MTGLHPVYLISGEDDAKIDAWRARLRKRAEEEGGPGALETFDARETAPEALAAELAALTFNPGTRYLLADSVQSWKAGDLEPLERALADMSPDTVLVLIARGKVQARLQKAVQKAGGEVRAYEAPKPWEMHKWAIARAKEEGLTLDSEAAKLLVASVGGGQQRLSREIEKLALAAHPSATLSTDELQDLTPAETAKGAYDLADALVAGDGRAALAISERLLEQEEHGSKLMWRITSRLREVHRAASLIEQGVPEQKVAAALGGPPWAAKKVIARAKNADRRALEHAICTFAELEIDLRGGGTTGLEEDTAFSLALTKAAAG
ncbi:MAG TPA: DNA polymerase III subunit delta [Thermoleophilaceae bacterium]|nr:DNA polymerase III subunit delta [Thermoleophilaceae bacterium]